MASPRVSDEPPTSPPAYVVTAAFDGLLAKRLVPKEGRRILGAFGSIRYPVTDPAVPAALRGKLAAMLLQDRERDERTAVLITMLDHTGLRAVLLPDANASSAETRLAVIDEEQGSAAALGEAVRTALAAITAVIAVSGL
ncbi:GOLPH3/VPS74 family protein [Streptomyces carpinensis]|uniref:GPP34 family phosphoprotein n=1 Tax=Streptomyces carpinensis TaxID=66369 RepID=A0ABV1W515_9ACTN|nr:GPP34 family phosphoprotein [Streptomyces carpinensis]